MRKADPLSCQFSLVNGKGVVHLEGVARQTADVGQLDDAVDGLVGAGDYDRAVAAVADGRHRLRSRLPAMVLLQAGAWGDLSRHSGGAVGRQDGDG